jgi:hypothetical protein
MHVLLDALVVAPAAPPTRGDMVLWGLFVLFFLGIGLGMLYTGVLEYRRYRYARDLPTSPVRSAAAGLVEVKGRAVAVGETLTSPFAERACLLCQYSIRAPSSSDDSPFPADFGVVGVPFYVEDDSGRVLVRPAGAEINLPHRLSKLSTGRIPDGSASHEDAPRITRERLHAEAPRLQRHAARRDAWHDQYGLPEGLGKLLTLLNKIPDLTIARHRPLSNSDACHVVEARLEEGDSVYVLGTAQPLSASDAPHDEITENASNLFIGRDPSASYFLSYSSDAQSVFLISTRSEDAVIATRKDRVWRQLGWGSLIFLLGLLVFALGIAQAGMT